MKFNTSLLHNAKFSDNAQGATLPPLFQVSAFACESAEQLEKVFNNKAAGYSHLRAVLPNLKAV